MKNWARRLITQFMDGVRVQEELLQEAACTVGVTLEDLHRCRQAALGVTRGRNRLLVLTPTNGQRLALPR